MLPKSSRLLLIQSVLCAIPVHSMLALDLPRKTLVALTKICRSFLWCGKNEASGGSCAVAWDEVCTPKCTGGLGLPNLFWMNKALRARWPWLQKVDKERPWAEFSIVGPADSQALVHAAAGTMIGNGRKTLFWEDRWIDGFRVSELAPRIYSPVTKRVPQSKLVADATRNNNWANDLVTDIPPEALDEFLNLWPRVAEVQLADEMEDRVRWMWEQNGEFSGRMAYAARYMGREVSPTAVFTWQTKAPRRCRFFSWLAIRIRCWTSDRLARRGLPHQDTCPLCNQHDETMQHLLMECVFARQIWATMGRLTERVDIQPRQNEPLEQWSIRQDGNSDSGRAHKAKCLLGMWMIWKQRNDVIFNGERPSVTRTIQRIQEEGRLWAKAGLFKGNNVGFEVEQETVGTSE